MRTHILALFLQQLQIDLALLQFVINRALLLLRLLIPLPQVGQLALSVLILHRERAEESYKPFLKNNNLFHNLYTTANTQHLFLQVLGAVLGLGELHLQPAGVLLVLVLYGTQLVFQVTLALLQSIQAAAQSGTLLSGAAQQKGFFFLINLVSTESG